MPYGLKDTEILEQLHPENGGATYYEIAEKSPQDIGREQGRYAINRLEEQGYTIKAENDTDNPKKNRYYVDPEEYTLQNQQDEEVHHIEEKRIGSTTKQTLTRKANEKLVELEEIVKPVAKEIQPKDWKKPGDGDQDVVIHETDVHFGDKVTDAQGNVIFDSDIAEKRVKERFQQILGNVEQKREKGTSIETAHLLFGGDLLTNESIYETQPYHIDETVDEQFERAVNVYTDILQTLSNNFKKVQVVCVNGNHGEFRAKGSSDKANGDDLIYDTLEIFADKLGMDNLKFVKSDRTDKVIFNFKGHRGLLTHGDNRSFHVGTSSPQSDWLSFKDQYRFDAAFRGHYHDFRIERVNEAPVIMTPSHKPGSNFEDSLGVYGDPKNVVYFASEDNPIEDIKVFDVE